MTDTSQTRTGTVEALRRSFDVAPGLRKGIGITLTLAVIGTALQLVVPIMLQQVIDNQILGTTSIDEASIVTGGLIALVAIAVAGLARWRSLTRLVVSSASGLAQLRVRTFEHLHRLSVIELQSERRGALVARVTSDVETIQHFMEWGGVGMILGVTQLILAMTVMLVYRWQLALVFANASGTRCRRRVRPSPVCRPSGRMELRPP